IRDLIGDDRRFRISLYLFQQFQIEVAYAEMFNLAVTDKLVQSAKCLFIVNGGAGPVDEIHVDIIHAEMTKTIFTGLEYIVITKMLRRYFCGDEYSFTLCVCLAYSAPNQFFGMPCCIILGC